MAKLGEDQNESPPLEDREIDRDSAQHSVGNKTFTSDMTQTSNIEDPVEKLNDSVPPNYSAPENPFDTTDDAWTYDSYLAQLEEHGDGLGDKPKLAKMSVLIDGLRVTGAGSGATYQASVGGTLQSPFNAIKNLMSKRQEPEKTLLYDVEGVVRAGEMLLVLGRPGSGCSTLLKNIAGFDEGYLKVEGDVKYNGVDINIVKKRFRGDISYGAEVEAHFPHLTTGQTLSFAIEARAPASRRNRETKKKFIGQNMDVLTTILGLKHTLKTKVGDDFVRGVSGGERKRVSIAELMAGRYRAACLDNPTRGLDASTSLELARAIRAQTNINKTMIITAAYQAGENFTLMFDKVTILYLGRQIFFGKMSDAKLHFEALGFQCKPRQTTADFLTAVTDPTGRRVREGFQFSAPQTPDDFVKAWKGSVYYTYLQSEIAEYKAEFGTGGPYLQEFKDLQMPQKAKHGRPASPYLATVPQQLIRTLQRSYQRIIGDKVYLGATIFSAIFTALINGSVFVNTPSNTSGFFSKGGVMFFCILFNALQTMSEVSTQYMQRPIVQKHKGYAFYHPFTDSLASIFADWPVKMLTVIFFDITIYFMVGLRNDAGAFFIFFLATYLVTLAMSALFRTVAAATKQSETASGIAGIIVLVLSIYTGYVIPVPSMHDWFAWLRHINPVSYGFEALMVNEFHNQNGLCTTLVPSGTGYENISIANQVCAVTGSKTGLSTVNGDDYLRASYGYEHSHLWRNIGILVAYVVFFTFTLAVATEFNPPPPSKGEFLVFRKGHEPEHVKQAMAAGNAVEDVEKGADQPQLASTKTNLSEFRGLVKSKDVFTWEHMNYDIKLSDGTPRRLLDDVTGYVKPGTLTALMGESGAGKTTLLNVLAQRVETGVVTGDALVNGAPLPKAFQRRTGYVQQQDVHVAETTVREALRFSALLRQTADVPVKEKYDYVESVIDILEMRDYAEAVIGSPGNGLNVEQRKRTTIGIELVAKPALLLFLDEPTSGLDSQSAWSIVRLLRKLANSGQAILCTIHQPSSVLFEQFDRLLLLKKGGRTVYFGDIGSNSQDVIDYFESNNGPKCGADENPAEYILNVIGAGATAKVSVDWGDVWAATPNARQVVEDTQDLKEEYRSASGADSPDEEANATFAVPFWTQYKAVQQRVFQNYWRNPGYINSKIMLNLVAGLFLGFTFYQEKTSVQGMQNKMFAVFMAVILAMPLMNQLQPRWEALYSIYAIREKPSKMYHWSTFVLSNIIAEIPYNAVAGTLFFIPWYFTVGFYKPFDGSDQNGRGVYAWLMIMAFEMWWSTFGQAMAAMSPNAQTAATFTTLFASFVLVFNGVLQPLSGLVEFWHWMYYLSPYTWLVAGLVSNFVSGTEVNCKSSELNIFNPPDGQTCIEYASEFLKRAGKIVNPDATSACEYCRYSVGDQYLETLAMSFDERWRNFGFMFAYIIFNAAGAFMLFYLTKIAVFSTANLSQKFKKPRASSSKGDVSDSS